MLQKFNEVSKCIRTLSTALQGLKTRADSTNHHQNTPQFLYHLVNLLTCGNSCSPTMANVVAATGRFEKDGIAWLLIVTDSKSAVSTLSIKKIPKVAKSFQDVVSGYVHTKHHILLSHSLHRSPDARSFQAHIADIWAALRAYDEKAPDARKDYHAMSCFVVMRSFQKLAARFDADRWFFTGSHKLYEVIEQWKPNEPDLAPRWVPVHPWLCHIIPDLMPEEGVYRAGDQIYWKLANETISLWATLLVEMLRNLDKSIQAANIVMKSMDDTLTGDQQSTLSNVNDSCELLYHLIFWNQRVVQFLLEKTSLARHLHHSMKLVNS